MDELSRLPSLKEELDRKTFETIEWLFTSLGNGKLSEAQFSTGIDALFMAVSGLTCQDNIDLITATNGEARSGPHVLKKHFARNDEIFSFTWEVGDTVVTVCRRQYGMAVGGMRKDFDTPGDARKWFEDRSIAFGKGEFAEL